jgi:hypothetical protein
MAISPEEIDILRDLRDRSYAKEPIFWIGDDDLAVFDPEMAQQIDALNFNNLTLPDKLVDLLRGRASKPFSWKQVRAAWIAQLRRLSDAEEMGKLATRMIRLLDQRLDRPIDLVWAIQEVCAQSLVSIVVDGLSHTDTTRIIHDQTLKLKQLLAIEEPRETLRQKLGGVLIEANAGMVIRRELRGRWQGRKPRQLDLTDPIVDLLPELGMGRAVDAVTGVLTAIAGPPGAVATCLLYELTRRPDWNTHLAQELKPIALTEFYAAPTQIAPITYRFVKESLRMWTPLPLMVRSARREINLEQICLREGQRYCLSPHLIHHDPRHWNNPDTFDPDRWLHETDHKRTYVPFGWSPRACIGASLGMTQLMLLCYLMCTRYRIELLEPEKVRMALMSVPLPLNFHGTITRR